MLACIASGRIPVDNYLTPLYECYTLYMTYNRGSLAYAGLIVATLLFIAPQAHATVVYLPSALVWGDDVDTRVFITDGTNNEVPFNSAQAVSVRARTVPTADGLLYAIPDPADPTNRQYIGSYGGPNGLPTLAWTKPGAYELDFKVAGPNHFNIPLGTIVDTIHFTITNATPPVCVHGVDPDCNDNVLFLPGIEASRLYDTDNGETKLWEPQGDTQSENLLLTKDGKSVRTDIYTRDIIETGQLNALVSLYPPDIYAPFIASMNDLKTKGTIADWEAIPYDWRLSLDDILASGAKTGDNISYLTATDSPYIIQEVKRLAASSKTGKITIVAHSNGGLLAKKLMLALGSDVSTYVDKIVMVDVPQLGTPIAAAALLHGTEQSYNFGALSEGEARAFVLNAPMTYNLLPSPQYFAQVASPVISFDSSLPLWKSLYGTQTRSNTDQRLFVTDQSRALPQKSDVTTPAIGNTALYDAGVSTHVQLDQWVPPDGVNLYLITGWGNETVSGLTYKNEVVSTCTTSLGPICIHYATTTAFTIDIQHTIDGDGTVVDPSSMWSATPNVQKWWVNEMAYNDPLNNPCVKDYCKKHANILAIPSVNTLVSNIVTDSTSTLQYVSATLPTYTGGKPRIHLTLHSPLTLGFVDAQGNYSGASTTSVTANPVFNTPGVDYERIGDTQWLSIPADLAGTAVLHGQKTGSFTLDIDTQSGDTITASTSFAGVPSATATVATLALTPGTSPTASSTLTVDYFGDNSHVTTLKASQDTTVVPDFTPPEITVTFSTSTRSISMLGVDDSGTTTATTTARYEQQCTRERRGVCTQYTQVKIGDTTTIADGSSNYLSVLTTAPRHDDHFTTLVISGLKYSDHVATTTFTPPVTVSYTYRTDRKGKVSQFSARITTVTTTLYALYIPQKDQTLIIQLTKPQRIARDDDDDYLDDMIEGEMGRRKPTVQRLNGLVIPFLSSLNGTMKIVIQ